MLANHQQLLDVNRRYVDEIKRMYIHQASPHLVSVFLSATGLPKDKVSCNVRELGNLVGPATVRLLHKDIYSGVVRNGDKVCFLVVGAGPERGGVLIPCGVRQVIFPEGAVREESLSEIQGSEVLA